MFTFTASFTRNGSTHMDDYFKIITHLVKKYLSLFLCLSLYVYLAIPLGMVTIPFIILASLYYFPNLAISFIKKRSLNVLIINYSLWIFVFGVMVTFHHFLAKAKESHAHNVLSLIENYADQYNHYPQSLEDLKPILPKTKYRIFYHYKNSKPALSYLSNYDPYLRHWYNFTEKKWYLR